MTKWCSKNLIYCHCFPFWRHNVYQPSLDKYNSCLCRTITAIFSTLKIARTCFCCVCLICLTAMSKHRSWGGGASIYIYIYIRYTYVFLLSAASFTPSFTQPSTADQTSQHHQPWRPLYSWRCKGFQSRIQGELICRIFLSDMSDAHRHIISFSWSLGSFKMLK